MAFTSVLFLPFPAATLKANTITGNGLTFLRSTDEEGKYYHALHFPGDYELSFKYEGCAQYIRNETLEEGFLSTLDAYLICN